ncbi:S8 family serine peptidase [Dinoroseobacter sp. S76]|uniref:S8 family serine peptidase n=1 Tax=Dinoroseobacter sp. S76 TaxID=3415124 RepID=UPI003C7E694A
MVTSLVSRSVLCGLTLLLWSGTARAQDGRDWLARVAEAVCPLETLSGFDAQTALPGTWMLREEAWPDPVAPRRVRVTLATPDAGELRLEQRVVNGRPFQFRMAWYAPGPEGPEPAMQAIADGSCIVQSARAIRAGEGAYRYLDQLDGDLATLRWTETLQAPWPEGRDPGGPRVAFVDSGLAYDLPLFRDQLARDEIGRPLGYDFWDLDPYPYDGDVARGAFFPIRHGTTVASVFVREAPGAAMIPYRYPRPDMARLGAALTEAHAAGARIVAMPLGSRRLEDWTRFLEVLEARDMLAIVSAGNDGVDIDARPIYPAALASEHVITVTSADGFGRLATGSNWGAAHVDLMLPAENLEITDFRGAKGVASGSSYAVPRLAALAARILAAEPGLSAAELRTRIFARAVPSPFERAGVLAVGWIADPLQD